MSKSLNLRLRSSTKGMLHLRDVEGNINLAEFRQLIHKHTDVPPNRQKSTFNSFFFSHFLSNVYLSVLFGFPPKEMRGSNEDIISILGIINGDTITVEQVDGDLSSVETQPKDITSEPKLSMPSFGPVVETEPAIIGEDGHVLRRVVDADNSCLFNSIGYEYVRIYSCRYVLEGHSRLKSAKLREIIAQTVSSNPETFTETFLGKKNEEYVKWIKKPESWGGRKNIFVILKERSN